MDMLLLGETINAPAIGQNNYGFWMPAGGNDGTASVEAFLNTVASAFKVHLETKSSDKDDSTAASIGNTTITAATGTATRYSFDVSAALDFVRYRVESLKAGLVHLQFAQPLWQPN
jgi:hypothetical protein